MEPPLPTVSGFPSQGLEVIHFSSMRITIKLTSPKVFPPVTQLPSLVHLKITSYPKLVREYLPESSGNKTEEIFRGILQEPHSKCNDFENETKSNRGICVRLMDPECVDLPGAEDLILCHSSRPLFIPQSTFKPPSIPLYPLHFYCQHPSSLLLST